MRKKMNNEDATHPKILCIFVVRFSLFYMHGEWRVSGGGVIIYKCRQGSTDDARERKVSQGICDANSASDRPTHVGDSIRGNKMQMLPATGPRGRQASQEIDCSGNRISFSII